MLEDEIPINLSENEVIKVYVSKDNRQEAINATLVPQIKQIVIYIFLVLMGLAMIRLGKRQFNIAVWGMILSIFVLGSLCLILVGRNAIEWLQIKEQNNMVQATVYARYCVLDDDGNYKKVSKKIKGNKISKYKYEQYVAKYEVDGEEYSYICEYKKDSYNIGKTIELYYDSNNPQKSFEKFETSDIFIGIISLVFVVFSLLMFINKNKIQINTEKMQNAIN